MKPGPAPTAERCPLCGQANQCAMETEKATGEKQPPCWCTRVDFSADLLGRLPEEARGKACICGACARRANMDCGSSPQ
jgi:hypothetical protein